MFQTDPFSLIILLIGLSLIPFIAMIATSYLKIVIVMSLIRNALGIQSIPPNMVINALALILTFYIMAPVVDQSWENIRTTIAESKTASVSETDNIIAAIEPVKGFLKQNISERQLSFFISTAERLWVTKDKDGNDVPAVVDHDSYFILIPSFCVSELTKAFQIGFLVYLPFIAIDIIISNILLAMGMMMVSPVTISLPFKLLLFVMVDGWSLLIQGLVQSYMH